MASNHNKGVNASTLVADEYLAAAGLFIDYPEGLLKFAYSMCIIFSIIGISGNLITIIALAIDKKFQNATTIFIISLHIDNFLFCSMILPMKAITFSSKQWILGKTLCKIYLLFLYSLNCTDLFTAVAITINRYIIICHTHLYTRFYKRKHIMKSLIGTWAIGFALFLPSFFGIWGKFDLDLKTGKCAMFPDQNDAFPKKYFVIVAFGAPYAIFIFCYSRMWLTVRNVAKKRASHDSTSVLYNITKSKCDALTTANSIICEEPTSNENNTDEDTNKQSSHVAISPNKKNTVQKLVTPNKISSRKCRVQPSERDKKLAMMIFVIVVSFTLCHLPITLTRLLYVNHSAHPAAYILSILIEYSSNFVNPMIYVIISSEYRQVYANLYHAIKKQF